MLDGKRPKECEYCWKVEDISDDQVSDRVFKSIIFEDEELKKCATVHKTDNVNLKTLEIAFDANCNFACSYCNASFSTSWQRDIKEKGPYQNLVSDGSKVFQQDGSWVKQFKKSEVNPYTQAFWNWWPELSKTIKELRITGGEATISPEFWKLTEWWKQNPNSNIRFAVNSNLGIVDQKLNDLIDASININHFLLYSSCEATGTQAEYIRDGLDWNNWKLAVDRMLTEGEVEEFHVMMTINFLCLYSITDFLDYCNDLKEKYGRFFGVCSLNILRFPSFMSPGTLPLDMRLERANHIERWLDSVKANILMHDFERDGIKRLITYLREVEAPHSETSSIESRQRDVKTFFTQYDARRPDKNFKEAFPQLADWYESIPETNTELLKKPDFGSVGSKPVGAKELFKRAKVEGWVLDPESSNPGSQNYEKSREEKKEKK
jgi:organic radical activating enzyme